LAGNLARMGGMRNANSCGQKTRDDSEYLGIDGKMFCFRLFL